MVGVAQEEPKGRDDSPHHKHDEKKIKGETAYNDFATILSACVLKVKYCSRHAPSKVHTCVPAQLVADAVASQVLCRRSEEIYRRDCNLHSSWSEINYVSTLLRLPY